MLGGDLRENPLFIHIVSIGFEFETHDISKFSLCDNGTDLVNSSLTLRYIPQIGIKRTHHKGTQSVKLLVHSHETEKLYVDEYIQESRPDDNVEDTQFYILNDMGDLDFSDMLVEMYACNRFEESGIDKSDIYKFVSLDNRYHYNLKFIEDGDFSTTCQSFSGVEFICTFLKPERSKNVIIHAFIDACQRIFDHLSKLEPIRGNLLLLDDVQTHTYEKIGFIPHRTLYHYPDTNLYYMQTYDNSDGDYYENPSHMRSLGQAIFIPQMTVGIKATHAVEVIHAFMEKNNTVRRTRSVIEALTIFDTIWKVTKQTFQGIKNDKQKTAFSYFFFIVYTMYYYLRVFVTNKNQIEFFKDSVPILSRYRVRDLFIQLCRLTTRKHAIELCTHPNVEVLLHTQSQTKDVVKTTHKQYGNPEYSLRSYFDFCLKPPRRANTNDWFDFIGVNVFSTNFKIVDPSIIIVENRIFNTEIQLAMQNQANIRFNYGNYGVTLLDLKHYIESVTTVPVTSCGRIICNKKNTHTKKNRRVK